MWSMPAVIRPPRVTGAVRSSSSLSSASGGISWPRCSATNSTSTWLTRVDLPEPETPVTVVNTPRGKATSSLCRLLRVTPLSRSQPLGERRRRSATRAMFSEQITPRFADVLDLLQPRGRAAVENTPPCSPAAGSDIHDPVGMADDIELMLHDE